MRPGTYKVALQSESARWTVEPGGFTITDRDVELTLKRGPKEP
jgi:hypothetical protein